ncbi:protein prenylyltransferase [Lichtheimia hyalospora FSU 10163]|nr:protein prenylyltransferase [Lichtheimia hyalospora FSU 10163]
MELLSKPLQAAADLDTARCKGQWQMIPELARRYKKYHPDESVMDTAACLEAEFAILLARQRKSPINNQQHNPLASNRSTTHLVTSTPPANLEHESDMYENDTPDHITLPDPMDASKTESILKKLLSMIQKHSGPGQAPETNDEWQAQFAKIILARIYFETARYDQALEALERLALPMQQVHSGYGMVLLIQARVIKGGCYEMQGQIASAIEAYEAAWSVYEQHPAEKGEVLWSWIEECLYRAILLHIRQDGSPRSVLLLMRGYMHLSTSHWSSFWRMHKRWIVFRHYARSLIKACQEGSYFPMAIQGDLQPKVLAINDSNQASAYEELLCLTALYRNLLSSLSSHSDPSNHVRYVLELAELMTDAHDAIGWGEISNIRRVLQFLQAAKERTFNSICIARYIFFCLMRLGNFVEAAYALRSYMELVGMPEIDQPVEDVKVHSIQQRLRTVHDTKETEMDVIHVLLAGVELYGREQQNGHVAAHIADVAVELVKDVDEARNEKNNKQWDALVAQCYRMRGSAYGLYAVQCETPEVRSSCHHEAIVSLTKAAELDPSSWQTHYELATQQAQVKDVAAALNSIGRSLHLAPSHLPSWHLLSLLYACRQFNDTSPRALETIQTALSRFAPDTNDIPTNLKYGLPVLSWSEQENYSRRYYEQAEAYLHIRMTQVALLEKMEGPNAVLKLYNELFAIYTKLAQSLGMNHHGEFVTPTPSRSSSKLLDVPAPPPIPEDTTDDGTIKKRPRKKSMVFLDIRRLSHSSSSHESPSSAQSPPLPTPPSQTTTPARSRSSSIQDDKKNDAFIAPFSHTPLFSPPCHTITHSSTQTTFIRTMRERWQKLLVQLWLMSTSTFIRAGRIDEAGKAVSEAEQLGLVDSDVWQHIGRVCSQRTSDPETALDAYHKALTLDPEHLGTHIDLASLYMGLDEYEVAQGLLERATQARGWDCAEAWLLLGQVYKNQGSFEEAKQSLLYAIDISDATPNMVTSSFTSLFDQLPRFVA